MAQAAGRSRNDRDHVEGHERNEFDRQQLTVLHLAEEDPIQSVEFNKNRTKGFRAWLFGAPRNYCLANQKLETLRRTAIIMRTRHSLSMDEFMAFRLAGYSREQFRTLVTRFPLDAAGNSFDFVLKPTRGGPQDN